MSHSGSKQFFSASHVFCTMLAICIFYVQHWGIQRPRGQGVPSVGPSVGGILQTLLLGYTTLASYKLYDGILSVRQFLLAFALPLPSFIYWSFLSLFHTQAQETMWRLPCTRHLKGPTMARFCLWAGRVLWSAVVWFLLCWRLLSVTHYSVFSSWLLSAFSFSFTTPWLSHWFRDAFANTVETISLLFIVVLGLLNVFFASFLSLAVTFDDHFSTWWNGCQRIEVVILCLVPGALGLLIVTAVLSQLCRITVVVFRFLSNLFWICFRFCYTKHDDETRPLLSPVS